IYVRGSFTSIGDQARPGLARLFANGALDASFAPSDPALRPSLVNSAVSPSNQLYVQNGTYYSGTVLRVAPDGSIDTTFPPIANARLIGIDSQGRLLVVIHDSSAAVFSQLFRYLPNGSRDTSYTPTGISEGIGNSLAQTVITPKGLYAASAGGTHFGTLW